MPNTVVVRYNGTDITSSVMFESASFSQQADGSPGEFSFRCKDEAQTLDFVTGKEITVDVDGYRLYGGYLLQVSRTFAFDADDTSSGDDYPNRIWELRGVDYNILFDKRVIRNTADYLQSIDSGLDVSTHYDGEAVTLVLDSYIDTPSGFDTSSLVENVGRLGYTAGKNFLIQQGRTLRQLFSETLGIMGGAVWYISPDKKFVWASLETVESRWGFSDSPNNNAITATPPTTFQGATRGFRDVEATEDGSNIINDVLVWGGGQFAGAGSTVFSRVQDSSSQSTHHRWQLGETHFGEEIGGTQDGVDAIANAIVNGPPGANALGQQRGLRFSQWQFRFTWFGDDVPTLGGVPDHLLPGDLVTIDLSIFGVTKLLPLRSLTITFPQLDPSGDSYVQFTGDFALNTSDPYTLWKYLRKAQSRITQTLNTTTVSTSNNSSSGFFYGSIGQFTPTPAPDDATTVFTIPVGYIAGSLRLYRNSLLQTPTVAYTESDPNAGQFTMTSPPLSTDELFVICNTLEG